ncbi:hypothetical protein WDZ92_53650 [Nostoc sp. NIES-2111]
MIYVKTFESFVKGDYKAPSNVLEAETNSSAHTTPVDVLDDCNTIEQPEPVLENEERASADQQEVGE